MSISFNGQTLVHANEGGYIITPGIKSTKVYVGTPARGRISYTKDLGDNVAVHTADLTYNVANATTIVNRLKNLSRGQIGFLNYDGFPSARCVIAEPPSFSPIQKSEKGYYFKVSITFTEL